MREMVAAYEAGSDVSAVAGVVCPAGPGAPSNHRPVVVPTGDQGGACRRAAAILARRRAAATATRRLRHDPWRATSTASPFPPATCSPTALHRLWQAALRLRHHHGHEHARLPLRVRVLQQRRVRRLLPGALAGQRPGRGRGGPGPGLRPHLVRRRRLYHEPPPRGRHLRGDRAPRAALLVGVPGPRRLTRRRDCPAHEECRLLSHLLRHRVGQRSDPAADEQEDHDAAGERRGRSRPSSRTRSGGLLHPVLPGRDRRHRARHLALRRFAAARLSGAHDALPPARNGARRPGRRSPRSRMAAGRRSAGQPRAHLRRRRLGDEDCGSRSSRAARSSR